MFRLTPLEAYATCLLLTASFVGGFYLLPARVQALPRDNPVHVKARFAVIAVVCAGAPFIAGHWWGAAGGGDEAPGFWAWLGFRAQGFGYACVLPLALTAMLFLVIGLELLTITFEFETLLWSLAVIPILLIARFIALFLPWMVAWFTGRTSMTFDEVGLMTWCGLRGGVSIAMAIALPVTILTKGSEEPFRTSVLVAAIVIVISTVLFQGLTIERVARVVQRRSDRRAAANASTPS